MTTATEYAPRRPPRKIIPKKLRDELLNDAAKYLIVYPGERLPADATEMPVAETRRNFFGPKRVAINSARTWR